MKPREIWRSRVDNRLEVGKREYGGSGLRRPFTEIMGEIEEELLDVAGWREMVRGRENGQAGELDDLVERSYRLWLVVRRIMEDE